MEGYFSFSFDIFQNHYKQIGITEYKIDNYDKVKFYNMKHKPLSQFAGSRIRSKDQISLIKDFFLK